MQMKRSAREKKKAAAAAAVKEESPPPPAVEEDPPAPATAAGDDAVPETTAKRPPSPEDINDKASKLARKGRNSKSAYAISWVRKKVSLPNGKTGIVRKAERGMCTVEVEGTGDKVVEKKSDLQLVPDGDKSPDSKQLPKLITGAEETKVRPPLIPSPSTISFVTYCRSKTTRGARNGRACSTSAASSAT